MIDEKQIDFACGLLYKFVTSKERRLKLGSEKRAELQKQIAAGEKVTGYRAEWLFGSASRVLDILIDCASEFNISYPEDMISVQDLKDVLATTSAKLDQVKRKPS